MGWGLTVLSQVQKIVQKFLLSRKVVFGAGAMGGLGVVVSSWLGGGKLVPEGDCDLVMRTRSILGDAIPLQSLEIQEDHSEGEPNLEDMAP